MYLKGGYMYPKWNSCRREFLLCYTRFTSLHFAYISLRVHMGSKANFATWSMIKEKDFSQLTFSPFKKLDERKQLISCLSSILTLLLLQLQAVIALMITQQQSHLCHLQNEAIMSRNNAVARYHSARKGLHFSPSRRCWRSQHFFQVNQYIYLKR